MSPMKEILLETDEEDQQELRILDAGCGEGELLSPLVQAAPWLDSPPADRLPPQAPDSPVISPTFNSNEDIPNLHPNLVHGLDISPDDLKFAIGRTRAPEPELDSKYTINLTRFEPLDVKLWEGSLEVINEEFVGIECIVTLNIYRPVYPFFVPILLGVYHPKFLLVTTPSYTFNARFTAPYAPTYDRVFRHSDHKFEWTVEEFEAWVGETAKEWGYEPKWTSIGRPKEIDPYGRDEELAGASFVVEFRKLEAEAVENCLNGCGARKERRELAAHHHHPAHPASKHPIPLPEIASIMKEKMEAARESMMHINELWFDIKTPDLLLKKGENGTLRQRELWTVEIVDVEGKSVPMGDYVPDDWTPGVGPLSLDDSTDFGESTGAEGDISLNNSEAEDTSGLWTTPPTFVAGSSGGWGPRHRKGGKGWGEGDWGSGAGRKDFEYTESSEEEGRNKKPPPAGASAGPKKLRHVASSTAGWDGDEDESSDTTS
ncbi:hypothetical protein DFP72DRAFT_1032650 [Ephemerocybe angulata]|uniref:Small RNA 2'-O-methyltransferase n=1 Tax=Ephemerocybe angulata TaxID=980116 RepID=A0A8H6I263_9AGAR|nr:hypothetical protein DFP72DRAFT_1032650 [Tulosesus angulatus]